MADIRLISSSPPALEPASPTQRQSAVALLENSARIRSRLALMQWIGNARSLLDGLRASADGDAALRDRLTAHDLGYYVPWDGEESAGLVDLIIDIGSHVDATEKHLAKWMGPAIEGGAA